MRPDYSILHRPKTQSFPPEPRALATPEQRKRAIEHWERIRAEWGMEPGNVPDDPHARLKAYQAEGWGDIKLSSEALARVSPDMSAEGRG